MSAIPTIPNPSFPRKAVVPAKAGTHLRALASLHPSVLFLALLLLALASAPAAAQEDPRPRELFQETKPPYHIGLALQPYIPAVGHVHFIVNLTDAETGEPVDGAIVKLRADHEQESLEPIESIETFVLNTPEDVQAYHANMTLPESGLWKFTIAVEKEGQAPVSVEVSIPVAEPPLPAGQAGTFVWILVFLTLIGGVLFLWNRSRKFSDTDSIVRHR